MIAYHFIKDDYTYRDGTKARLFVPVVYEGSAGICKLGLCASKHPFDALRYSTGSILCRVKCADVIEKDEDRFVCRKRTPIAWANIEHLCRQFACKCALDVVHRWNCPRVVLDYLKTSDEEIQNAAWAATWAPAWNDARRAARSAARNAAWAAAWAATWDAAWAAAWDAARAATWDAARKAMWAATWAATWDAAWDTTWDAARADTWDAARAAQGVALDSARSAAIRKYRVSFARMCNKALKENR